MPPKSKAQARFFRAVASGDIREKGLSKKQALEFVAHVPTKKLPERVQPKRKGGK